MKQSGERYLKKKRSSTIYGKETNEIILLTKVQKGDGEKIKTGLEVDDLVPNYSYRDITFSSLPPLRPPFLLKVRGRVVRYRKIINNLESKGGGPRLKPLPFFLKRESRRRSHE